MFQSPQNNLVVQVDTKYTANLFNMIRAANINHGSQINPADYVNIIGRIVSLPKSISKRKDYEGFTTTDMKVGDHCIMRYDVIFDFEEQENGSATYKNYVWYKGHEFWLADVTKIFAVIRGGKIIMVNGYCMLEDMTPPSMIILPQHLSKYAKSTTATLTHIGNNLYPLKTIDAKDRDTVYYNSRFAQEYEIKDKKFAIVRQKDILGVELQEN